MCVSVTVPMGSGGTSHAADHDSASALAARFTRWHFTHFDWCKLQYNLTVQNCIKIKILVLYKKYQFAEYIHAR